MVYVVRRGMSPDGQNGKKIEHVGSGKNSTEAGRTQRTKFFRKSDRECACAVFLSGSLFRASVSVLFKSLIFHFWRFICFCCALLKSMIFDFWRIDRSKMSPFGNGINYSYWMEGGRKGHRKCLARSLCFGGNSTRYLLLKLPNDYNT